MGDKENHPQKSSEETARPPDGSAPAEELQALRRSEHDLADFFENASIPLHCAGQNGIILRVNRAELETFGYDRDEYLGHHIAEFHVDRERAEDLLTRLKRGETVRDYEARIRAKDGSVRHVLINASVLWDNGQFVHTRTSTRDISSRQEAERRTAMEHAVTRILAESQTLGEACLKILQAICEYLAWEFGAFWEVGDGAKALRCLELWRSPGKDFSAFELVCHRLTFARGVGLPGRVWSHREPAWIADVTEDANFSRAPVAAKENLHGAFAFPIKAAGEVLGVMEFFSSEIRPRDEALLKIVEAKGSEIGQFVERLRAEQRLRQRNRDLQAAIDALRRSEEKLRQQSTELEQQLIASGRLVSLGEITASMAHEFNNPLGIIMGFIEDMLGSADPADPNYRALKIVDEESKRCKKIISDLMEYARPRTTELCLTDLSAVIEKTLQLVENRLYKQKITLVKDFAADLPRISADPQQLEQVLINLYLNAIDAMPDGGRLTVGTRVESLDGSASAVVLTVADTGFGIEESYLSRIFQPFFSAKKRRGLGLGLPICARIVKNHGGQISVESQAGRGTTFRVHLPLSR